jgi:8-oxo-dGTP diphosphatase
MNSKDKKFNVRVYGIYLNDHGQVLLSDEFEHGFKFTKFPGGGLEFGEGTIDCIKRECMEELGQEAEVLEHFYTTDFFQQSAFNESHQLISIYYLINIEPPYNFAISNRSFDFPEEKDGAQSFRLADLGQLKLEDLTFPVDKRVLQMLKEKYL